MLYFYRLMCHLSRFELACALTVGSNPAHIAQLHRDLSKWERELHTETLSRQTYSRCVRAVRHPD